MNGVKAGCRPRAAQSKGTRLRRRQHRPECGHSGAGRGRRIGLIARLVGAALLAACGGGSDDAREIEPPPPVVADTMSGTVATGTDGPHPGPWVKGVGLQRSFPNEPDTGKYSVTLQKLDPPYMLEASGGEDPFVIGNAMHSVSRRDGNVNVTPLTTLVSAYAVGQVPSPFFDNLDGTNDPALQLITDDSIAFGERRVRTLLADWGIAVPAEVRSFVYDPFDGVEGDPMFELLAQFRGALVARRTTLPKLLDELGTLQALCRQERVGFTAGTREDEFCPSGRSTQRVEGLDVYRFTAPGDDTLVVRAAPDGRVAGVELMNNGTATYACSASGCDGITVAAADAEGRRRISFARAVLARSGGGAAATLDGRVLADALGAPSPQTLSCVSDSGFYHALLSKDNTFPGTCVQAGMANASGPAQRITYFFFSSGSDNVVVDGEALGLRVHADGTRVVSVILQANVDPFDLVRKAIFKCGGVGFAPCSGVTVEPGDGVSPGRIALDDTVLFRVDANGAPVGGDTATVRAASLVTMARQVSPAPNCEFFPEVVNMTVSDGQPYAFCPDESNGDSMAGPLGEENLYMAGSGMAGGAGLLSVYTLPGSLQPIRVEARREQDFVELFVCDQPACLAGVSIVQGGDGRRTVSFNNVALQERDLINTAGDRAATLTDGAISFAPFE